MLYIQAKINGVPVKVFVDSGAQSTILSKRCAEHCGILRLVDEKFAGTAVGVGSARIIGRVHMAPLVIGERHFPCTFTVLDQNDMDCLLGLDMLKRYQVSTHPDTFWANDNQHIVCQLRSFHHNMLASLLPL